MERPMHTEHSCNKACEPGNLEKLFGDMIMQSTAFQLPVAQASISIGFQGVAQPWPKEFRNCAEQSVKGIKP